MLNNFIDGTNCAIGMPIKLDLNSRTFSRIISGLEALEQGDAYTLRFFETDLSKLNNRQLLDFIDAADYLNINTLLTNALIMYFDNIKNSDTETFEKSISKLNGPLTYLLAKEKIVRDWVISKINDKYRNFVVNDSFLGFSFGKDWKFKIKNNSFINLVYDKLDTNTKLTLKSKIDII